MDTLEDSENNAKISDSAYSNSCSNSQSRRSHSSKSTHSGSNSSGSSGYGGKPSSASSNNLEQPPKKDKEAKKKKLPQNETLIPESNVETETMPPEPTPVYEASEEETHDVVQILSPCHAQSENVAEKMEICTVEPDTPKDEVVSCHVPVITTVANYASPKPNNSDGTDGFSCVISMHDGVVMYTTTSLTTTLGFPKEMWVGRSFIDFVHPRDRATFASQITNNLAGPNDNGTQEQVPTPVSLVSSMVCRLRKYRSLTTGFGVKERNTTYMPVLLKLTFKNINEDEGKTTYLVLQATPFFSAFKTSNEKLENADPFVMRHAANGRIEYIDAESVPYLGYLPQELAQQDALLLYHPDDLAYLRQIYETIVKEGGLPRCKSYRMKAQNGGYVKLETEWSSFINPWSKNLEFVIGKHHVVEGPKNPDIFLNVENEKPLPMPEIERNKALKLRENIIRILNEALTKPAEAAKQQMNKRCQDIATFMESLIEEHPKPEDELRVDIHDADNSYYERDSVMLGGISPHHEYEDSQSSTETPLSYNQLNYNDTLQRYFESHQPLSPGDYRRLLGENLSNAKGLPAQCLSPMAQNSGVDSGDLSSSCESNCLAMGTFSPEPPSGDYQRCHLTESILLKHNAEMEKELTKMHRENRPSNKCEREKVSHETRLKKKEHLARCNATFQPTSARPALPESQPHGVKRSSKPADGDTRAHKHHCTSSRQTKRRTRTLSTSAAPVNPSPTITTTVAQHQCPTNVVGNMNTFYVGLRYPQQMTTLAPPVANMPGMFPMYYAPATMQPIASSSTSTVAPGLNNHPAFQPVPMHCMVYGHAMYGVPFMYAPMGPQVYPVQNSEMNPMQFNNLPIQSNNLPVQSNALPMQSSNPPPLELPSRNYEQSAEAVPNLPLCPGVGRTNEMDSTEETVDKTDGESSYSSFYSSFFKTDSGSAEDSGDKNEKRERSPLSGGFYKPQLIKKIAKRKMEPPWMEQVCVTSELIYKYEVLSKTVDEVLAADKLKLQQLEQPDLVNDQLGQLYLDLNLNGVSSRLMLEEGLTSSSSSGEETTSMGAPKERLRSKGFRRKREYSKLVMIYEEDAPLPPPPEWEATASCSATS